MNFNLWISRKMHIVGSGNKANSSGIGIAVAGVAITLFIMEATLAIVLGFKNQITERVLGFEPPIAVLPAYSYNTGVSEFTIECTEEFSNTLTKEFPKSDPTLMMTQPGILKTNSDFCGVYFKSYGPNYDYSFENRHLIDGKVPNDSIPMDILISNTVAKELELGIGQKIDAYFFVNDAIKMRKFNIGGLYDTGFSEYDKTIAYAPISTLQRIAAIDSLHGTSIILQSSVTEMDVEAEKLQQYLIDQYQAGELTKLYPVDNALHTGAVFFNWLSLLDTNVVVIFILMGCVAAFTLISSMFILILDRVNTIGVLRALGTSQSQIRVIFTNLAMKAVITGLIIGNIFTLPLLLIQQHYGFLKLDAEMYYLHQVPIEINWWWFLILNCSIVIVAWLVLLIPARAASRISPACVMRFE